MTFQGEQRALPANPVRWFEIYVENMDRAKRFYEALLGVVLQPLPHATEEMLVFPGGSESAGCPGALIHMPGVAPGGNSVLVYFGCDDCEIMAARAIAAGGEVHKATTPIGPYGHIALLLDTEGNMFGVHSAK